MPDQCEPRTSSLALAADCSPISSSDMNPSSPLNGTLTPAQGCANALPKDGFPACTSTKATCDSSISNPGPAEWIASQRDSLVKIFLRLAEAQALKASVADLSQKSGEQSTKSTRPSSTSKIRPASGPKAAGPSSRNCWREDIPGETESLVRLMSTPGISAIDGGCLLPTLTVCGNFNRKGASPNSGDGLATALRNLGPTLLATTASSSGNYKRGNPKLREWVKQLPTLCATDFKGPYSAEGYQKQTQQRSKPLRDTLVHTTGHRLTPGFAEWWMGWPIGWTGSSVPATAKSRSRRQRPGSSSPKAYPDADHA